MHAVAVIKIKNELDEMPVRVDAVHLIMQLSKRITNTERTVPTSEVIKMIREAGI